MKAEELRALDAEELGGRLKGARRELYELRFKLAVGQLDNHREIRKARKEIAQILTVVHQRRLGAVEGEFEEQPLPASQPEAEDEAVAAAGTAESDAPVAGAEETEADSEAVQAEPAEEPAAAEPVAGEMTTEEEPAPEAGPTSTRRRGRKTSSEDEEA
jgi:large subunit ribosomal protein L29